MQLLKNEIEARNIPDLFTFADGTAVTKETWDARRAELREILSREIYGYAPEAPADTHAVPVGAPDERACAGKVRGETFRVAFTTPKGEFSFPVNLFVPKHPIGGKKPPLVVHLNFRPDVPDRYFPLEEITDAGFAAAQICYQDVTSDDGDMTNGIAGCYPGNEGDRDPHAWGKLRMWAFAASRLLDVLMTRSDIDAGKIVVAGHSRLGKTALLAAAMDDRFAGAVSNDSGCSGAAVTRGKTGERVEAITRVFPYWFCPAYRQYADREDAMPFDQHDLTALLAPRLLCIGSAWEDTWADPGSEFMTAVLTDRVYGLLDTGVIPALEDVRSSDGRAADRFPACGEAYLFAGGRLHYHVRPGLHFFSREDWNQYLAFFYRHFYRV